MENKEKKPENRQERLWKNCSCCSRENRVYDEDTLKEFNKIQQFMQDEYVYLSKIGYNHGR
jgi:hypothetical protein